MAGDVVELASLLGPAGAVIILAVAGALKGKGHAAEPGATTSQAEVLAASFVDAAALRDLAHKIADATRAIERHSEQQHDDSRAMRTAIEESSNQLRRNTEAQSQGSVTPREMYSLLARMDKPKGATE